MSSRVYLKGRRRSVAVRFIGALLRMLLDIQQRILMMSMESDLASEQGLQTKLTFDYPSCPEEDSFFSTAPHDVINLDEEETTEQRVSRVLEERYSIEERIYLIVNKQTGQVYDVRNDTVIDNLLKESSLTLPEGANVHSWGEYWRKVGYLKDDFIEAVCKGNLPKIQSILKQQKEKIPLDVNFKSFDNWTSLHFAAYHSQMEVMEFLLKKKAEINAKTKFGWTALHIASKKNQMDSAMMLLEANADPNIKDEEQYTALHYAAQKGDKPMIQLLLKFKANHKVKNMFGRTPKDCCLNADAFKAFPIENINGYDKYVVDGVIIPNGRADHIEKLLSITKQDLHKGTNVQITEKTDGRFVNMFKMYKAMSQKSEMTTDDFLFYRRLGRGAFGEVWLAKRMKDPIERYYAIKILNKDKIVGNPLERYIKTEKDVLSLVSHPFLVHLYYSFQNESKLFLVMKFCEGGDMGALLNKKRKFSEEMTKLYTAEIILALEALHKNLIIYRDLKPDNLMIDKDGHVMITDFGLSKKTTDFNKMNTSFCGTPAYMPLQILDKKGHNRMADWYTLGVVVYQFLTGLPPFYSNTRDQLFKNKREHLLRLPKNVSEQCKDFLKQLLQKDYNKRLGIERDAESVRQHPWFKGIDWQEVYNRELKLPKPDTTLILGNPIKMKFTPSKEIKNMDNWSYAM